MTNPDPTTPPEPGRRAYEAYMQARGFPAPWPPHYGFPPEVAAWSAVEAALAAPVVGECVGNPNILTATPPAPPRASEEVEALIRDLEYGYGPVFDHMKRAAAALRQMAWDLDVETQADHPLRVKLEARATAAEAERDELREVFEFQREADMRAIKMWQEAHGGKDHVWPDSAKLTVWLMEQLSAAEQDRDRLRDALEEIVEADQQSEIGFVGFEPKGHFTDGPCAKIARAALAGDTP